MLATAIGVTSAVNSSAATTLADFGFAGGGFSSSDASTNWTTSDLGSGGGVPLATDATVGQPAPSLALTMGDINDGTFLDGDYTFTVTPNASVVLDFTEFSFDINKISGGANVNYLVFSSIGGFTSGNEIGSGAVSAVNSWNTINIGVTSLPTVSTATEFRLYLDTSGTFGPNEIKIDNVVLTGDVTVIPEPCSLMLVCVSGLLMARRRRQG